MKKIILMAAVLVTSLTAKAWKVGDFYPNDPTGVPAAVAYVDETGEHGLLISPVLFTQSELESMLKRKEKEMKTQEKLMNKSMAKMGIDLTAIPGGQEALESVKIPYNKTIEFLQQNTTIKDWKSHDKGHKAELFKKYIDDLAAGNSEYGEQNTKAIFDYCAANSVDMELYFPAFSYAARLGDGWFVPGNYELEQISKVFVDAVGEDAKYQESDIRNKRAYLQAMMFNTEMFYPICYTLNSSTMVKSPWTADNKSKTCKAISGGSEFGLGPLGQLLMVAITASITETYYSLYLRSGDITGKQYYAFCSNYSGYIVSVKRF